MKSARMLTGLTQESFAEQNAISLTSLKCWEMGRAVPRKEGALSYVNAIKKGGIDVSLDWIFHGSGPGPTYINGTQIEKPKTDSSYVEQQIDLFKKHQLSKGRNPIVVGVQDEEMSPQLRPGDLIGGYYITVDEIRSSLSLNEIVQTPWLLNMGTDFIARYLVVGDDQKQIFYRSNADPVIKTGQISVLGRICWHFRDSAP
jgi:DNA-binding XRE family transcriptional regulator